MFSVCTTLEEFKIQPAIASQFGFLCLRKTGAENSHNCRDVTVHEILRFQTVFRPRGIQISVVLKAFSKSSVLVTDYLEESYLLK